MFGRLFILTLISYHLILLCTASLEPVRQRVQNIESQGPVEAVKRIVGEQDLNSVRLSSCNRRTVDGLSVSHWKMLEDKYKEFGCWKSKVAKLYALLYKEEKLGHHFEYPSGSQGYRLRCRLLFKFDLCRSNFIRVRAAYHPEISTNWPEPVMRALTERLALDDGEDYGDDYYNSYSSYNNFNNHINTNYGDN